jgi:chromosomal replication initiation ATPase DnaA
MTYSYAEVLPIWPLSDYPNVAMAQQLCDLLSVTVAAAFAIPVTELHAATRRPPAIALARQSAMYLAHVVFGLTLTDVGHAFGRDRTTAAYACELVEDRRDDPAFDAVLEALENACGTLLRRLDAQPQRKVLI